MSESTKPVEEYYTLQPDAAAAESLRLETAETPADASAEKTEPSYGWMMVRELVETVVLSLIIFLLIRQVVQNYRIENHSMEPSFYEGQFVLVNKIAYWFGEPKRGDVVVFHNPRNTNEDYIKRVIGIPGDTVEVRDQSVYINGLRTPEEFPHRAIPPGEYTMPVVVGDNELFVMGDNRPNSSDSRVFGPINQDLVVGQAWLRIWPLNLFGIVQHEDLAPAGLLPE
jgi:signal peptidase I